MISKAEADYLITSDGLEFSLQRMGVRGVLADNGRGMPPIEYFYRRGYGQHGQSVLGYRLQPRTITLDFRDSGRNRVEYWTERRAKLIDALRPNRATGGSLCPVPVTLRKILPNGQRRDILAYSEGTPAFDGEDGSRSDPFGIHQVLTLTCPDPTFFDPGSSSTLLEVETNEELVFPITFDSDNIYFGSDTEIGTANVTYSGTWVAYPVLVVTGPYSWLRVRNLTTGGFIQLGVALAASQTLTIDLTPGAQTITDGAGADRFGDLADGNLVNFVLAPHPIAANGVNTIRAYAGDASAATTVTVRYNTRYIGI